MRGNPDFPNDPRGPYARRTVFIVISIFATLPSRLVIDLAPRTVRLSRAVKTVDSKARKPIVIAQKSKLYRTNIGNNMREYVWDRSQTGEQNVGIERVVYYFIKKKNETTIVSTQCSCARHIRGHISYGLHPMFFQITNNVIILSRFFFFRFPTNCDVGMSKY